MNRRQSGFLASIAAASCLALLGGCGSGSAGPNANGESPTIEPPPSPPPPEPEPPPAEFTIIGEVFSFATGMIGNADVNLWVQTDGFGYSYWWARGPLRTDELGLFEARVPESDISVLAFKDGFVQPCGVRSHVEHDAEVRVEMLPASALVSTNPPRPQSSSEPSLTGTIFEDTSGGRQIVTGAYVWIDDGLGLGFAYTYSDLAGHYYLCRLPTGSSIYVLKDGFETRILGPIDTTESVVLDIVLEREGE